MTREEYRQMLLQAVTTERWVEDVLQNVVIMMQEFHVHDPNVFLEMPVVQFDELWLTLIQVQKKQKAAIPSWKKQGHTFG